MEHSYPKFLNDLDAEIIVDSVVDFVTNNFPMVKKTNNKHIVILMPSIIIDNNREAKYPSKYKVEPFILYQKSFGDKSNWERPYDEIAQCKAIQLWDEFNPGGKTHETPAHLLFPDYTPFWGGDKMEGIVVACSGFQPWFDKMISRMILSALIGVAHEKWEASEDKRNKVSFLSN